MDYGKAAFLALGGGLLLAIAVATIDRIIVVRLASGVVACPHSACTRMVNLIEAEPTHLVIAFVVGFAAAFTWLRRAHRRPIQ